MRDFGCCSFGLWDYGWVGERGPCATRDEMHCSYDGVFLEMRDGVVESW